MPVRVLDFLHSFYPHVRARHCSRLLADYIVGQGYESSQTTYKGGSIRSLFLTLSSLNLVSVHFSTSCSASFLPSFRSGYPKMARARTVALVASALLALAAADTQHCYYPDGTNADAGTSPCNTTAAVSACCDPRDSCTISGLCLGASGWIYRSSCTDRTWTSLACPSQCHIGKSIQVYLL